ncbi:MAG: glucoamylase family protein [Clostridia bacterium]
MKNTLNSLFIEVKKDYKIIRETYKILETTYDMKLSIHSAGQWLLDNMYIIEEEYECIIADKNVFKNRKLPMIKTRDGNKYISIFFLAYELIEKNTGYVDQNLILDCLKEHQKLSYLTSEELDLFILMLKFALLKFISCVCGNIANSQLKKIEVEKLITDDSDSSVMFKLYNEFVKTKDFKEYMLDTDHIKNTNTAFVEYMAYKLRELGQKGEKYFNILKEEAEKIGFTIEGAIEKEHMEIAKTTDFIGRAILSFKQLKGINFREIFEKVNKIDDTLKDDYTNEFKKCDYKTKSRYRRYIIKLAKKYKLSEVYVAKKAIECSKKYKKHVGFFLIGDDKYLLKKSLKKPYFADYIQNNIIEKVKVPLYILAILVSSCMLTLGIAKYIMIFNNIFINTLFALCIFLLSSEISQKLLDYLIRKFSKAKVLPRFDFAKTVGKEFPTYVVMPTVISSIEKLDEMIEKMEVTYLANRSDNMYYMLLGDCISSDKESLEIDKKIVEYAKYRLDSLNSKYKNPHKLFNFMYRKRIYSKAENAYMGWERKRGALSHFNKLILGKLTKEEINNKMYLIYDDIIDAKYAITIDEDTQLSLNTAKDLVAIISHPLNQPVLSKDKKRVIKGYGIIQPSVGLDIESANKSIFSKIFGGFGGLDIYTNAVSNVYQDVFSEAIFCGKGIYNIELFEDIMANEIPENLVLSHDLLEGSLVRTGLASDIELQDGFPNNYIAYMKRNHRWYRGDMQIIRWLLSPKSKLNMLSKWKIFDNIRRPLIDVVGTIAIFLSIFTTQYFFIATILYIFLSINVGNILSLFNQLIFGRSRHTKELQYIPIIHGFQADLLTMCFNFITMPYRSYMCINAFTTSLYRMIISKKNLLQWTTGETLEKTAKNTITYYSINMISNILFGLIIMVSCICKPLNTLCILDLRLYIGLSFVVAPLFSYLLGKDHLINRKSILNDNQKNDILDIAKKTWSFFDTMMNETNNYIPTDNFQENRRYKIANRTSPTNIGLGILAIIDAYDLNFINIKECIDKITNTINTVIKLENWNGHLYNWYNIKTLESLRPRFISTVDSGNFIACLYILKEFLIEIKEKNIFTNEVVSIHETAINDILEKITNIINNVDFTVLYDTSRNLFSIGYAQETGKLVDSYYDMLMSESRTTSLIAIASRQVTSKHWFALARNLVRVDGYRGLKSWTGTSFEYFMPYIFNKSYEHTLIDQSLFFTKYSNIKYAKINNVPWGISESAYAVKDEELNYQYKAFGIPWLGLKRGLNDYLVISPYSSLLMLPFEPLKVYKNILKLKKIGMYSTYGFYESVDYTKEHLGDNQHFEITKTYMAHHQGMILSSINNYINDGILQKRFHCDPNIKACEILLKERERMHANITKTSKEKENTFNQKNVDKFTSFISCVVEDKANIENKKPLSIAMLKGHHLSSIVTNTGAEYIKYKDKIINSQKFSELNASGNYIYITDKTTGRVISVRNTDINSKYNTNAKKTIWTSSLDKVEAYIEDENLEITTTTFLSPEYNIELNKVSMYNNTNEKREILINTYIEPVMTDYMTNIVHPSFNNLQIETLYNEDLDTLIAHKRKKGDNDTDLYVYSKLIGIDLEKQVETEKQKLLKDTLHSYQKDVVKYPLWPILSYRATIILDPYERQEFTYILGVADTKYKISNAIVNLDNLGIEKQYKLSGSLNNVTARYLKLENTKAEIYNNIIKDLLFKKKIECDEDYWNENLNQSLLWKYSISGDLPIILVYIEKIEDTGIINELINFMDYSKSRGIDLDIVVLIDEENSNGPIYTYIKTRLDRATYMNYSKGNIFVLNMKSLTKQEVTLLSFLSNRFIQDINELLIVSEDTDTSNGLIEIKNDENKEESTFENK